MRNILKPSLLPLSAAFLLAAAVPSWQGKEISQWSEQDARQILANSPWAKLSRTGAMPRRTEDQMRAAGNMGGTADIGFEVIDGSIFTGVGGSSRLAAAREKAAEIDSVVVTLRWESALPIRAAELRAKEAGAPPDWEGDFYVLSVYGVPKSKIDLFKPGDLKRGASLKLDGKKDVKPERAELWPEGGGLMTIVYFFPRTTQITLSDKQVEFTAQIGPLWVAQFFATEDMQYEGKLAL